MSNKATRAKADAVTHWVPQNRDEVNQAIAELGANRRERTRVETRLNDEISSIRAPYDSVTKTLNTRASELIKGIHLWCEANRAQLTKDGRVKFHDFATGQVKWRLTPWAVGLSKVADVIALLKAKKLQKYVRTKEEVDKDALLADRLAIADTVKGVTFKQKEEFAIVPEETKVEEVQG